MTYNIVITAVLFYLVIRLDRARQRLTVILKEWDMRRALIKEGLKNDLSKKSVRELVDLLGDESSASERGNPVSPTKPNP